MKFDLTTYKITDRGQFGNIALVIGLIGIIGSVAGWYTDSARFYHSWLTSFVYWVTLALGCLFFTMLHYITSAHWSVVIRRISEAIMIQLPWLALAFIPIYFGAHDLYHWSHEDAVATDHILQAKSGYLNIGFFSIRTAVYFLIWILVAVGLRKKSLAQDAKPDLEHIAGLRKLSAGGMLLFALTITFASFDWMMSLNPHWYSTIFGVYIFGGSFLGALALMTVISIRLRNKSVLKEEISFEHYHDLGKLMFAFTIFWAYIGFSQYFLIWYGNIPEETTWYLTRWEGTWKSVSLLLFFGHFAFPFVVLIFQRIKRHTSLMMFMAVWLLVMHWVDIYWLVYPTYTPDGAAFGWIEITTMLGIGGIFMWMFARNLSAHPLLPTGDPWLKDSINFINH